MELMSQGDDYTLITALVWDTGSDPGITCVSVSC